MEQKYEIPPTNGSRWHIFITIPEHFTVMVAVPKTHSSPCVQFDIDLDLPQQLRKLVPMGTKSTTMWEPSTHFISHNLYTSHFRLLVFCCSSLLSITTASPKHSVSLTMHVFSNLSTTTMSGFLCNNSLSHKIILSYKVFFISFNDTFRNSFIPGCLGDVMDRDSAWESGEPSSKSNQVHNINYLLISLGRVAIYQVST